MVESLTLLKFCGISWKFAFRSSCYLNVCFESCCIEVHNYFIYQLSKTLRLSYCYVVACNVCLLSLFLYNIVVWVHDCYNYRFNNFLCGPKFLMVMLLLQKAMLLQQSTWQNNVRMGNLVEQVWVVDSC